MINRYLLNRSVFGIIYITICYFSLFLGIKKGAYTIGISFFIPMMIITYIIDRWITIAFVNPSITLALTNARIIDEETKVRKICASAIVLIMMTVFAIFNCLSSVIFKFHHIHLSYYYPIQRSKMNIEGSTNNI